MFKFKQIKKTLNKDEYSSALIELNKLNKIRTVVALDNYKDIFDDFDIESYRNRRISNDFKKKLIERLKEIDGNVKHLNILITVPDELKVAEIEEEINNKLLKYFNDEYNNIKKKFISSITKSATFLILGSFCLLFSNLFKKSYLISGYFIVAFYFFTWKGLDNLINTLTTLKAKLNKILKTSNVSFISEEKFNSIYE